MAFHSDEDPRTEKERASRLKQFRKQLADQWNREHFRASYKYAPEDVDFFDVQMFERELLDNIFLWYDPMAHRGATQKNGLTRETNRLIKKLGMTAAPRPRRGRQNHTKARRYMPNSYPKYANTSMNDLPIFGPRDLPESEVLLGVYGSEDWIGADSARYRHLTGQPTVQRDVTWIVPATFDLADWVEANTKMFTFFGANRCIVQEEDGMMKLSSGRGKLEVEVIGGPQWVRGHVEKFDSEFSRAENLIEWVYSERGDTISVPLNFRPAIKAAYPWIDMDLNDYIDRYLDSQASVLILIGKPGTGKTTFIKNLIHRSGADAKVAYDEKVMMGDGLFAGFIDDESRFLIMEDADAFLQSRTDGNTMMHKFLNVSDGLISAADKKLVFSTNLDKVTDIDEALMRPGRCFDVIEFRELTIDEAKAVIAETGSGKLPTDKDGNVKKKITLAEIFSVQPSEGKVKKARLGFV